MADRVEVSTEYGIEAERLDDPGLWRRWQETRQSREAAEAMVRATRSAFEQPPKYRYRIITRTVTVTTTPWSVAEHIDIEEAP